MKILCETTGEFSLVDYGQSGAVIEAHRPSVVSPSHFVNSRSMLRQIKFLADLNDEATDEEFAKYLADSDGDVELAVSAFIGAFGVVEVSEKKSTKKSRREARAEAEAAASEE